MTRATWTAAALLLTAFVLAYAPDVGHGFVSDDFTWLVAARAFLDNPSLAALTSTTNFLRPLVTLSFATNLALFGGNAAAFGWTNLFLAVACAVLIYNVCRALSIAPAAALTGAATWAFNFHGINMAMLWISGRTSLLLTFCALVTALCMLRGRVWLATMFCAAALFAKEEAVALPFILAAWVGVRRAWPLLVPLAIYFGVRAQTSAFWPRQAPDYYRFTTDISAVLTNAAHYLDRGATVFALALLVLLIATRTPPPPAGVDRGNFLRGLAWFAAGYALTVWVPVRSSLYAVFPSVGAAVMLASIAHPILVAADARRLRQAALALVVLPFLLWPVYRSRNVRWVELADLTRAVVAQMQPHVAAMRAGTPIWIQDDNSTRANVRNAFGGQMDSAMQFHYGVTPRLHVTAEPGDPPPDAVPLVLRSGVLENR